jgi:hypothetical protein
VVVTLDYLWMSRLRAIRARTPVQHVVVTKIPDYLPFPLNLLAPLKLRKTGQIANVPREEGVHAFKELIAQNPPRPPKVEFGLTTSPYSVHGGTTRPQGRCSPPQPFLQRAATPGSRFRWFSRDARSSRLLAFTSTSSG